MKIDISRPIYLLGAGGHAKVIVDMLILIGAKIGGYHDYQSAEWIDNINIPRISDGEINSLCKQKSQLCMAFLGRNAEDLKKRLDKMKAYQLQGAIFPIIIHPKSIVSESAKLMSGVQVLAGAVINALSTINNGAVINTGSIVEHDVIIGNGVHIAPRSTVLGAAQIGDNSYLGSGCTIIQGCSLKENSFIKSGLIYNG